jgi:hypothetical protein
LVTGASDNTKKLWEAASTPATSEGILDVPAVEDQFLDSPDHGLGPGQGGDKYDLIVENNFLRVLEAPLSTFSIDVDTAS